VIVNNLHVSGFVFNPNKANSPLFIDADAILPCPIALEFFEPVAGWSK
jgi:hypothetical protein